MAQTPPTNNHYVELTIKMSFDSQQNPVNYSLEYISSMYGEAPKRPITVAEPGYVLEYVAESGDKICSSFQLLESAHAETIFPLSSVSIPTEKNGTGYRIYKDGVLLWTEDLVSPTDNLPISVEDIGGGKLRILPESVKIIFLSRDGGLHWKQERRPPFTSDWVYQISKYDPLKLPKPLIRIDVWHKLRRQTFTYEVGAVPAPLTPK